MNETACTERFREFRRAQDKVLDQDLEALRRRSERDRIGLYNDLKRDEDRFESEFLTECPDFLTSAERDRIRGEFRLARLLVAASFYAEDNLSGALEDEFTTAELDAVVEFDRYRIFDTLSKEQIERKIRRMDGEVYELVSEYTSTQLENIESLMERQDVQQVLIDRLLARYEDRREKIRRGFFTYVETHGLEHMVSTIENAVRTVAEAADERSSVRAELQATVSRQNEPSDVQDIHRSVESDLTAIAKTATSGNETVPDDVIERIEGIKHEYETFLTEIDERIEHLDELEMRLDQKMEDLTALREQTTSAEHQAAEGAMLVVDREINAVRDEQSDIRKYRDQLERERERINHNKARIEDHDQEIDVERTDRDSPTIDSSHAISAEVARLMEMDYLGRFDISMNDVRTIRTPTGMFNVPEGYWENRSERRSERTRLAELVDESADSSQYPLNQTARYEITSDRFLGLSREPEMIIEATVYTTLESHVRDGFDATPAGLDIFLRFVDDAIHEAELRDCEYLLAIASPTGWTDNIRERISGNKQSQGRVNDSVSVCLVDLRTGEILYDETDPIVAENVHLFEPTIEAERVAVAVDTIRHKYIDAIGQESVTLQRVTDEHGFDSQVVTRAFQQLSDGGEASVLYVDDVGLSLKL